MDIEFQTITVGGLLCFIICFCVHLWRKEKKPMPPELKGGWPIIGHLHQLGRGGGSNNTQLLHRFLGSLDDKLGPTFTIRIGMRRVLIVSSWEITKECFTTNDRIFSTRPNSTAAKLMGYNSAMFGLTPYCPYWREMRKLTTLELLSNRRLEMLKGIRDSEIKISVKELYDIWFENGGKNPILVEMKRWFGDLAFNVTVKMIAGKRYFGRNCDCDCDEDETRRAQKAFSEFMRLLGVFVISDAIPFLRFFDLQGYEKEMKRNGEDMDLVLGKWVSEHRDRKKKRSDFGKEEQQKDFIDVMLSILNDEDKFFGRDVDTVIKSTCISLILGGYETTMVTLTWALSLLLNNPQMLRKAQAELDIEVGKDRQVEESDVKNLVYIQGIVKETLRLYPPAPISPPRQAMEDCTVAGFHISKGTQLMVNLWKLQRDPRVWSDPSEFKPERFLKGNSHADIDVRGQHFEFIPFSSGRRGCPGISFAMQILHLTLARLLHGFDFSTPSDKPIDMTESLGLTCPKATPLDVLLAPRLPTMLYATDLLDRTKYV